MFEDLHVLFEVLFVGFDCEEGLSDGELFGDEFGHVRAVQAVEVEVLQAAPTGLALVQAGQEPGVGLQQTNRTVVYVLPDVVFLDDELLNGWVKYEQYGRAERRPSSGRS